MNRTSTVSRTMQAPPLEPRTQVLSYRSTQEPMLLDGSPRPRHTVIRKVTFAFLMFGLSILTGTLSVAQQIPNDLILKQMQRVLDDQRIVVPTQSNANHDEYDSLVRQFEPLEEQRRYQEAIPIAEKALMVAKRTWGPEGGDTSFAMIALGRLYMQVEDYARAEALFLDAVHIQLNQYGFNNPQTADGYSALADFYDNMAEYSKAEPLYARALQNYRNLVGSKNVRTARKMADLASLYADMNEYDKAEPLCLEALQVQRSNLDLEDLRIANSLAILGRIYEGKRDYAKAQPLLKEALEIRRKKLGPDALDTAYALNRLGMVHHSMGDLAEAEPLLQEALNILQRVKGPNCQDTADVCGNLALLEFDLGRVEQAAMFARQEAEARLTILTKICSFGSEEQRLAYFNLFLPFGIFPELKGAEADLATAVLRYKGVVLDSMIEDRQFVFGSGNLKDKKLLKQLDLDRTELNQLSLEEALPTRMDRIKELEEEITSIEGQFAKESISSGRARGALTVTLGQVQSAISDDSALLEYLRYPHYLGNNNWEQYYGVLVLLSRGAPVWIPLGQANGIDAAVQRYARLVRALTDNDEIAARLQELDKVLWAPIRHVLPDQTKKLIVSPDGQLNFVSFATLLDDNSQFLAQSYEIRYVATGRDLLRKPRHAMGKNIVFFANPAFDLPAKGPLMRKVTYEDFVALNRKVFGVSDKKEKSAGPAVPKNEGEQKETQEPSSTVANGHRNVQDWGFANLPGTEKEVQELAEKCSQWGWTTTQFASSDATKEELLKIRSPYILHLATHGFFENADPTAHESEIELSSNAVVTKSNFFKNPMHRSGLALAGAQTTADDWKKDLVPPVENDGIVTAEDVSRLDLRGTWLVALSACDTASGQARIGEGVMGLRRGFIEAGAQNLLMTLWPIDDAVTVQIMADFYETAHEKGDASAAIAKVQGDWLVKFRNEKGLAAAVNLAGPFIMSSQGSPLNVGNDKNEEAANSDDAGAANGDGEAATQDDDKAGEQLPKAPDTGDTDAKKALTEPSKDSGSKSQIATSLANRPTPHPTPSHPHKLSRMTGRVGDTNAIYEMGVAYENSGDYLHAIQCYGMAAARGDADAKRGIMRVRFKLMNSRVRRW
jgi:CHAT domain-containing protein/tetratricopeptide (TPR) repeat protein